MIKYLNAFLPLNLQFFAAEGEQEASETNPDGQSSAETPVESSDTSTQNEKTFTQSELDEIIADRLKRATKKFADYDELKAKADEYAAELEAKRQAELSETERAQEIAKQFEEEKNELTAQLEALRKQSEQERIRNEFTKVASSANIEYIDDAIALADLSAVSIDEDGKVVGMDDVVKALVENKPFLVAKKQKQPIGAATNGGGQQYHDKPAEQILEELRNKARKSGRIEDRVAYDKARKQYGK
ncbi:DUF4355 domain-containing protein [Lysinibacillus sp. NPDC097162]|uniref:phage scaffolding protein n=1 Tax=Lysinibacillus sp. NPDC097162 TaxID=3364140 RepID=UPI00381736D5